MTWRMSRKTAEIALAEMFLPALYQEGVESETGGSEEIKVDLSLERKEFVQAQERDEELMVSAGTALSEAELKREPAGYCVVGGVLRKKGRPSTVPADEEWGMVPKSYGDEILNLAHKIPLGGHFGGRKTDGRIMKEFYWLHRRKDVIDYCRRELTQLEAINMLKAHHDQKTDLAGDIMKINEARVPPDKGKTHFEKISVVLTRWENSIVLTDFAVEFAPLIPEQSKPLRELIKRHAHVGPDVPRRCKELGHGAVATSGQPSEQHPYRMINSVTNGLKSTEVYIGDVVVWSDTWEEHIMAVEELVKWLSEASLTVNLAKSEFGRAKVTYLGFVVGQGQLAPMQVKVRAISEVPNPTDKRALRRFLEMVEYYRKFCREKNNFVDSTHPLTKPLPKNAKLVWDNPCYLCLG
ncbi:uncharacterized protein [Mobula birostris]|uniref:uncharacterized protein n=1 Tax=Mobula birostris TaxID=1983395 RepID=UPI003B27E830